MLYCRISEVTTRRVATLPNRLVWTWRDHFEWDQYSVGTEYFVHKSHVVRDPWLLALNHWTKYGTVHTVQLIYTHFGTWSTYYVQVPTWYLIYLMSFLYVRPPSGARGQHDRDLTRIRSPKFLLSTSHLDKTGQDSGTPTQRSSVDVDTVLLKLLYRYGVLFANTPFKQLQDYCMPKQHNVANLPLPICWPVLCPLPCRT